MVSLGDGSQLWLLGGVSVLGWVYKSTFDPWKEGQCSVLPTSHNSRSGQAREFAPGAVYSRHRVSATDP